MCQKVHMNFTTMPFQTKDFETKDGMPKITDSNRQDYKLRCNAYTNFGTVWMWFDFPNGEIYPTQTYNFINETTGEQYTVPPNTAVRIVMNNSDTNIQTFIVQFDNSLDYIQVKGQTMIN